MFLIRVFLLRTLAKRAYVAEIQSYGPMSNPGNRSAVQSGLRREVADFVSILRFDDHTGVSFDRVMIHSV
jgi:hypothetical protein